MNRRKTSSAAFAVALSLGLNMAAAAVEHQPAPAVRTPEQILAESDGRPTKTAARELFINASEWDPDHQNVRESSLQALITLGAPALEHLLAEFLPSLDVRRRVTLDKAAAGIGAAAAAPLLPYVRSRDLETRRHAIALLGTVCHGAQQTDACATGPFPGDRAISNSLRRALKHERDDSVLWTLLASAGKLRDPGWISELAPFLAHSAEPVRLQAAAGLAAIPDPRAATALLAALDDPLGSVRQAAVVGLSGPALAAAGFAATVNAAQTATPGSQRQLLALDALARIIRPAEDAAQPLAPEQCALLAGLAGSIAGHAADDGLLLAYLAPLLPFASPELTAQLAASPAADHPFAAGRLP